MIYFTNNKALLYYYFVPLKEKIVQQFQINLESTCTAKTSTRVCFQKFRICLLYQEYDPDLSQNVIPSSFDQALPI